MNSDNLVGQILDGKYKIERELGKGGMGTVWLAEHIGTERHVAVKVIVPQFMRRAEFVERFRREARAAGRLRHPNVVDVTDFGFAQTGGGQVAYLVMEYLDGCTLGEILEEEKRLPLEWSLDILEQTSSAVQEAHNQGIIHRDLKPDNIWLEPDRRGGYIVKVLDFGIAKLESGASDSEERRDERFPVRKSRPTQEIVLDNTVSESAQTQTFHDNKNLTIASEKGTLIENTKTGTFAAESATVLQPAAEIADAQEGTIIFPGNETKIIAETENIGTKILSEVKDTDESAPLGKKDTRELTRVGAIMGTPLYMSPEQCRGEKLSPASDIYSLGIIAYQMLSGKTPFHGEFTQVMEAHKNAPPPPIITNKVPKSVKKAIFSALSKNPDERPPSAESFAGKLRSQAEGVWALMGRALVIFSENFFKFISLSLIIYLPMFLMFVLKTGHKLLVEFGIIEERGVVILILELAFTLAGFFCGAALAGIIAWLVAQKMAVPMRPLELRPAFAAVKKRLKNLFGTVTLSSLLSLVTLFCLFPFGLVLWTFLSLVAPVVMLEGLKGRKAYSRSYNLVKRKFWTALGVIVVSFCSIIGVVVFASVLSRGLLADILQNQTPQIIKTQNQQSNSESEKTGENNQGILIKVNPNTGVQAEQINKDETEEEKRQRHIKGTIRESAYALIQLPFSILIGVYFAVVLSLLYIQTRLAGGESLADLLEKFEETDAPRKKWQERVRGRLLNSGRITSKVN